MPASAMNAAHTMNAPTASAMPNPAPLALAATPAAASTAAPGVDQATMTGCLSHPEGNAEHRPMPNPNAHIQEVICAGLAPNACAA